MTDYHDQQFRIVFSNNLFNYDLALALYIDGERIYRSYLRARQRGQILGIPKTTSSVLPFKFQELQLVGAFPALNHSLRADVSHSF